MYKNITNRYLMGYFLLILNLCVAFATNASHFLGGELAYDWRPGLAPTILGDDYRFTVTLYGDPGTVTLPAGVTVHRESGGSTYFASAVDTAYLLSSCADTVIMIRYRTAYNTISIPIGSTELFYISECCRTTGSSNLASSVSRGIYIATVFVKRFVGTNESSPVFLAPSNLTIQANTISQINFAADDVDGDSLYYSLRQPREKINSSDPVTTIPYNPNYSSSFPFDSTTTTFIDPLSGLFTVVNPKIGDYSVVVRVDSYRNGQFMGRVFRDINIRVQAAAVNSFNAVSTVNNYIIPAVSTYAILDSTHIIATTEGAFVRLDVTTTAASSGTGAPLLEMLALSGSAAQAAFTGNCTTKTCHSLEGNTIDTGSVSATLNFYISHGYVTSPVLNKYRTVVVATRVFDQCGSEKVVYVPVVFKIKASSIYAQPTSLNICEGQGIMGNILGQTTNIVWSPTTGVNNITSPNPFLNPITSTIYTVTNLLDNTVATVFVNFFPDTNSIHLVLDSGKFVQQSSLGHLVSNWFYNGILIANSQPDMVPTNGVYYTLTSQNLVCPTYSDTVQYNDLKQSALVSAVFDSVYQIFNARRIVFEIEGLEQTNIIENIYYVGLNPAFNSSWDYNIKDMNNNMQVVSSGNQFYEADAKRTRLGINNLQLPIDSSSRYEVTIYNLGGNLGTHPAYKKTQLPFIDSKGIFKLNRTEVESPTGVITTNLHLPLVISFQNSVNEVITIEEQQKENLIRVFPNPVKDEVQVMGMNNLQYQISFFDAKGCVVLRANFKGEMSFSLQHLNPGMYFYQINDGQTIYSGRIVKL